MTATRRLLVEHVVTTDGVLDDALLEIAAGEVIRCDALDAAGPGSAGGAVRSAETDSGAERVAGWVVPGFVDTHVHGGGGFDYATDDPAEALLARRFHAAHGTTTSFASLVSADLATLLSQIAMLADLVDDGHFAGIHLEGPFLAESRRGAHDPGALRPPDAATVDRLIEQGRGTISMVTMAPELPGGDEAITRLVGAGVRVAFGHSDADAATTQRALEAGATVATHLFNAMRPIHHREPGPVPVLLGDERVLVELIADGFHLHPEVLKLAMAAAGSHRVALITDAMAAAGMPDGDFELGGLQVAVRNGAARLVQPDGELGSIAGSTLTMADAFGYLCGLGVDLPQVAAMASTNPARCHGLDSVGVIEVGRRADLCVVDEQGSLQRVMQSGQWLERDA